MSGDLTARNVLAQQLADALEAAEPQGFIDTARAVLASGLVVPTGDADRRMLEEHAVWETEHAEHARLRSDVLALAQQWTSAVPDLTATRGPERGRTLAACADELRALIQQEPR